MQGKDIHWRDDRNIETLKSVAKKHKTLKSLADYLGLSKQNLVYVLNRFLPEVRNSYRTKSKPKFECETKEDTEVEIPTPPNGAQFYVDAMFYKINSANKVMRHNGFEWVSSTRSVENLKRRKKVNLN